LTFLKVVINLGLIIDNLPISEDKVSEKAAQIETIAGITCPNSINIHPARQFPSKFL
jgi:hypothetical protein